jgi:hypothetical protein
VSRALGVTTVLNLQWIPEAPLEALWEITLIWIWICMGTDLNTSRSQKFNAQHLLMSVALTWHPQYSTSLSHAASRVLQVGDNVLSNRIRPIFGQLS